MDRSPDTIREVAGRVLREDVWSICGGRHNGRLRE
jgi:hypothetical protein